MTNIYQWPTDWYSFASSTFKLTARSQVTPRTWIGGKSVYGPHAQLWTVQLTLTIQDWDSAGQYMAAFFSRLGGQAGLMRIGDPARREPQYNRQIGRITSPWSDSTFFDDGSGWSSGPMADLGYVAAAASRGDTYIVLGGLHTTINRALRRGDLLELRQNGIATETPNLYEVQVDGSTDIDGFTGVEIRPPLRQNFAAGDMAVFRDPMSVFRLTDDDQGAAQLSSPTLASIAFNLVEAIV